MLKPAIIVFGLAAAGREGKLSSDCLIGGWRVVGRLKAGAAVMGLVALELTEDTVGAVVALQGDCDGPFREPPLAGPRAGNGSRLVPLVTALPQEPCLETADRDDCAVLFFSVNTRRPPDPLAPPVTPGRVPLGPGRLG